jgi:hypothetical protein
MGTFNDTCNIYTVYIMGGINKRLRSNNKIPGRWICCLGLDFRFFSFLMT